MESLAEIVESQTDWIGTIDDTVIPNGLRILVGPGAPGLEASIATILLESELLSFEVLDSRTRELYTLRRSGLSDDQIAERLDDHPEDVHADLRFAIDTPAFALLFKAQELDRLVAPVAMAMQRPGSLPSRREREIARGRERVRIGTVFLDELHDLLCTGDKHQEEQASLLKEYRARQSTLVASIAVVLAPHLGAGVQIVAAAVAVTLSVIGQVGLKTWCATQAQRRRLSQSSVRHPVEAGRDSADGSD